MEDSKKDGAAVRVAPPLVYLGGIIVGVILHAFMMPLPIGISPGLRIAGGAIGLFRKTGQDPKPWESTPQIISTGIYRITRNPMYVGMALLQIAIGVGLANWWVIILVPIVLAIVYTTAVRHEEHYLQRKFPDEYSRYKASVRRWI